MTDQLVKDNERIDDLQNGYYVIQDPDKFCFGMDAVLLSGFAKVKKGEMLWIWEQERELSRSCLKPKQMGNTLQVLRFRKSVRYGRTQVSDIIIWRTMLRSYGVILRRLLIFLGQLLLM